MSGLVVGSIGGGSQVECGRTNSCAEVAGHENHDHFSIFSGCTHDGIPNPGVAACDSGVSVDLTRNVIVDTPSVGAAVLDLAHDERLGETRDVTGKNGGSCAKQVGSCSKDLGITCNLHEEGCCYDGQSVELEWITDPGGQEEFWWPGNSGSETVPIYRSGVTGPVTKSSLIHNDRTVSRPCGLFCKRYHLLAGCV